MTAGPGGPYGPPQPPDGYSYPQFQPPAPKHPSSTTALVLGIISLAGILTCGGVTLVLSPFAWVIGGRAVKEIDAAPPGTYSGRDHASAGRIMGIVGTVLLILGVIGTLAVIGLFVGSTESTTYGDY